VGSLWLLRDARVGLNGFSRDQFSLGIALGGEPGAVAIAATVLLVTALLSGLKNLH